MLRRFCLSLIAGLAAFGLAARSAAQEKSERPKAGDRATREMTRGLLRGPKGYFRQVTFSPDGKLAAAGVMLGSTVIVWDVASGKETVRLQMPAKNYDYHLRFSRDGRVLVSEAREDKMIRTWNLTTGKQLRESPKGPSTILAFTPDGKFLASAERGFGRGVSLVDVSTGRPLRQIKGPDDTRGGAFSPDGKMLATHGGSGEVALWDVATGEEVRRVRERQRRGAAFAFVTFSPDGKLLATGGHIDSTLRIWDVATGKKRLELGCSGFFVSAAFSPDGNTLATGATDGLKLYDLAKGREICALKPEYTGQFVAFSPDGSLLAIAGGTGNVNGESVITLINAPRTRPAAPPATLSEDALEKLWADLTTENDFRLQQVLSGLRAAPRDAVPFLTKKLRPIPAEQKRKVEQLIKDLDDDEPKVREKATEELQLSAAAFEPLLTAARKSAEAGEMRNRLTLVLRRLPEAGVPRPLLSGLRAIDVLERFGTPDARKLLEAVAAGAPRARLTEEAKAALDRLKRKTPAKP